jgi:predicted transposase YdaD
MVAGNGSSGMSLSEGGMHMSKREYKSSVFSMLLEEPENALDTYNALNKTDYADPGMVRIQRLDGKVLLSMRNDASFLIDAFLNLYEHQSTYNPNMPLRFMLYFSDMLWDFVDEKDYNIYGSRRIPVPTPKFVVFYNGIEKRPAREVIRLSDSYEHKCDDYDLDLVCTVYNINPGYNDEMQRKSKVLLGYTTFVEKVRTYERKMDSLEKAINQAIDECIKEEVLAGFFTRRRTEVLEMAVHDFTFERQLEMTARDSREEGREVGYEAGRVEGHEAGRVEGHMIGRIALICKKHQKKIPVADAAEMLEEDEAFVQAVYGLADEYAPDYDVETIYKALNYLEI